MVQLSVCKGATVALSALAVVSLSTAASVTPAQATTYQGPSAVAANDDRTLALTMAVRERAMSSSFQKLDAFAEQALKQNDADTAKKIQHTINLLIEQNEFENAERWNKVLAQVAIERNKQEYTDLTKVNTMMISYLRDGVVSTAQVDEMADHNSHWLPTVMAKQVQARILLDEMRPADAMRVLAGAISIVSEREYERAVAAGVIWSTVALVHGAVDDMPGFIDAVKNAEKYKAAVGYPDPDYNNLYMLALSLGAVGRYDEAQSVVAIYRELAERNGTEMSRALAGNVCGLVETAADDWSAVLSCYEPFGANLDVSRSVLHSMLPRRATAYARTGQVMLAQRDLTLMRSLLASGEMRHSLAVDRAEAEYLIAKGDYARGIPMLRNYHLNMYRRATQRTSVMMEQAVLGMDERLKQAKEQTALKVETITAQRWLVGVGALLGFVFGVMFFRQRALSRRLQRINIRQKRSQMRQAELFTNISHEIRTPLNGVVAMADALSNTDLPREAAKMARIISASSNTLERLMSDILDIAKIEAGQVSLDLVPFNLTNALNDVASLWQARAEEKGLQIVTQFGSGTDNWVLADPVRLTQVLNNLVSNALKFTEHGKIVVSVIHQQRDKYLFAVTDSGVGFDVADKDKLFARFQQADSTITRRYGGTGLGLPISRQLVELMGGELDCDGAVGAGSQFWFELNLPRVEAPMKSGGDAPQAVSSRYLIVDDNATNRTILAMLLKNDSRQLHFAENGREAVDLALQIPFDVILMDMQMPVMSGIDAIKAIRANEAAGGGHASTIVILSANAEGEHMKSGAEAGADGHIAKPIVLDRLLLGIDQAVQKRATDAAKKKMAS